MTSKVFAYNLECPRVPLELRTPLNLVLMNLAVSDLGISCVGSPVSLMAAMSKGWGFGAHNCVIYAFLMSLFDELDLSFSSTWHGQIIKPARIIITLLSCESIAQ
ncbi:G protein-coupled receptor rhodopsin-like [Trinorchestia longiramus]|nr:G protein-coupled receptor rhodopsin-like [Trinorchestia longiramus]